MAEKFLDYIWKNGKPKGIQSNADGDVAYKIVADPYFKRISIEKYQGDCLVGVIYDSALLDFRHLKPAEQNAWQKMVVSEEGNRMISHIRNQDDRLILIEEYRFENQICRGCSTRSSHGVLISEQKIFYEHLGDSFNGVVLFDSNRHIVMYKRYTLDPITQAFTDLLEECSDLSSASREQMGQLAALWPTAGQYSLAK